MKSRLFIIRWSRWWLMLLLFLWMGVAPLGAQTTPLVLQANPTEGGTLKGGGNYAAGQSVTVKATTATNFRFLYWTDADGVVISASNQFAFIKTATADTLTAHFLFDPGNPDDPAEPVAPVDPEPNPVYYRLTVMATPTEGGTVSGGGNSHLPGTKVTVKATAATNFVFSGWYDGDDTLLSNSSSYQYTTREQADTLWAHFTFNPGSPGDPAEPSVTPVDPEPEPTPTHVVNLIAVPSEGGTVNFTSMTLIEGNSTTVKATTGTNFVFSGWYVADTLYASSKSFSFCMGTEDITLEARFAFSPNSPEDPAEPVITPVEPEPEPTPTHVVTLTATPSEGGSLNFTTKTLEEGSTTTVTASAATNFVFSGWYVADTLYASSKSFSFRMGTEDITLEARFTFSPGSPGDPEMPSVSKQFAFYLMNRTGKPGDRLRMPLYLTALEPLTDMTFRLTFPEELPPDMQEVVLSSKATGYTVDIVEENAYTFVFTLTGGNTPVGNLTLVTITVPIPDDMPTGVSYPVHINQVSVTRTNGEGAAASTRNGRLGVNKWGDTNGDDTIDLLDKQALIAWILSQTTETYYEEVWDVNNDGKVDVRDAMRIVEIIEENSGDVE